MRDFQKLRHDPDHHLGLGDIRLTVAQQDEIETEITRLRALVRFAFQDGYLNRIAFKGEKNEQQCWNQSESKRRSEG